MEPHDYDTDNLSFSLQRTSAFHFLWFWKTYIYLINCYMTFIIYQREPQLKAKTHYLSITLNLQMAIPLLMDFQLNCQMEREMSCYLCLI